MRKILGFFVVAGLLAAAPAAAQLPADSLGWRFIGTLGYVQTSGNTSLSTVNVGDKLYRRPSRQWLFSQSATYVRGKSAGTLSANQVTAGLRADYSINEFLSAFANGTYEANPFAGLSHRTEELLGLSWRALTRPRATLSVDIGGGETQERSGRVDASYAIARLAPTFRYTFRPHAYLEEAVEMVENLKSTGDLRTRSQTTLVAPLSTKIGLGLGLLMLYDAEPSPLPAPAPAGTFFKKLDTTFTAGIQITL
jgi:putative salt-induced outer membrane protein YdiY